MLRIAMMASGKEVACLTHQLLTVTGDTAYGPRARPNTLSAADFGAHAVATAAPATTGKFCATRRFWKHLAYCTWQFWTLPRPLASTSAACSVQWRQMTLKK